MTSQDAGQDPAALRDSAEQLRSALATAALAAQRRELRVQLVAVTVACADLTESAADLQAVDRAVRDLLDLIPANDRLRPRSLAVLGSVARRRWSVGARPQGLDEAVTLLRAAVDAAGAPHPDRALCLANLGNTLLETGDDNAAQEAVAVFAEALSLTGPDRVEYVPYLTNLGTALTRIGQYRPEGEYLDRATEVLREASHRAGPLDRARVLASLAGALHARFGRSFQRDDLTASVTAATEAMALMAPRTPFLAAVHVLLGQVLADLYRLDGVSDLLAEAIGHLHQALRLTPPEHAARPRRLAVLADALRLRGEANRDAEDFRRAEALLITGVRHPSVSSAERRRLLVNVTATLIERAGLTGEEAPLDHAITIAREIEEYGNLSMALELQADWNPDSAHLDEAVDAAQRAVSGHAPGVPGHATALAQLAVVLQARYRRTGRATDLDAAVDTAERAVTATPEGDPRKPDHLSNLGNTQRLRALRTRQPEDFDKAVENLRASTGRAHRDKARHLSNLGAALLSRAEISPADTTDVDEAVAVLRLAVEEADAHDPRRPEYWSNLANALVARAEHTVTPPDLSEAVALHRKALATLPPNHTARPVISANLAAALGASYSATGEPALLNEAIHHVTALAGDPAIRTQDRLVARWRLADLRVQGADGSASAGLTDMQAALVLAERAAWIGLAPLDRDYALTRFATLPMDAAASEIASHRPEAAVAALEAGRSVGWRDRLHIRHLDALAASHPDLAERLRSVGRALEEPATPRRCR
ncbi:hypothetical protein ACIRQQ_15800 [Streptomyces fuscichromogenes]|uniref:hypothetical protein n=1 Tax=Streptomyces fuscichromogenes TaxID=1324013 RepID=UPI00382E8E80